MKIFPRIWLAAVALSAANPVHSAPPKRVYASWREASAHLDADKKAWLLGTATAQAYNPYNQEPRFDFRTAAGVDGSSDLPGTAVFGPEALAVLRAKKPRPARANAVLAFGTLDVREWKGVPERWGENLRCEFRIERVELLSKERAAAQAGRVIKDKAVRRAFLERLTSAGDNVIVP